ncbi:acyltransferase family protein [Starkeya sp. ORNL1]|uniref:acyltransferase family protein n=1 Tax=Starkeya sp. ORNL1 TaxID=2709380 RepID=UPI001FEDEB75|nr:acyltransferase family protein [Starkeya sp. ORNL1]
MKIRTIAGHPMPQTQHQASRVDWVDMAKGFCIVFVVMMHSTLGVQEAAGQTGFMDYVVAFARPFRMPDFFLISGLFLARVIDRDWRTYLDRKVVHFAYFYVIWFSIQFIFKAPGMAAEHGAGALPGLYLLGFIEPFGTLWFIYLLPIFFVVTKATRALPPVLIWLVAAALEIATVETGWTVIDEFCERFVFFYTGYLFARYAFALASGAQRVPLLGLAGLLAWGLVNGFLVFAGYAQLPVVSLLLGLVGAGAVITLSALMAKVGANGGVFSWLEYAGRNSIVIYLAFFLPMAVTRAVLLKTGLIEDIGVVSLIVTAVGVVTPLIFHALVRSTALRFLFVRPERFKIERRPNAALAPAE